MNITAGLACLDHNHSKYPVGDPMRIEVPGGWGKNIHLDVWQRYEGSQTLTPSNATLSDHQSMCFVLGEWLMYNSYHVLHLYTTKDGKDVGVWDLWPIILSPRENESQRPLDCDDNPLAARVAAYWEVVK